MRAVVLLCVLLVAACASRTAATPGEAECRAEAYKQPQVKAAMARVNPSTTNTLFNKELQNPQEIAREAVRDATIDCMRRRGFATPGGVEPVKSYPFSSWGS